MKLISTKLHGVIDYLVGILLIAAPWMLGFADDSAATYVPVVLGGMALIYSLLTAYELGAIKLLPMSVHLVIDVLSGILLAASPWLFGFSDYIYLPHLVVGIMEVLIALMTRTVVGTGATNRTR